MKRNRKFIRPRNYDPNLELAYLAGHRARLEGKKESACNSLLLRFSEKYAAILLAEWKRGWNERDRELQLQARLPYREN